MAALDEKTFLPLKDKTYIGLYNDHRLTPKIDTAFWGLRDMGHGLLKDSDMGHGNLLDLTGQHGHF